MEKRGKVSGWQDAKGYRFILPDNGEARVFFHHSSLVPGQALPMNGDSVRYTEHPDGKGGTKAHKVWTRRQAEVSRQRTERIVAARKVVNQSANRGKDSQAFWLTTLFAIALAISVFMKWMPQEVALVYLIASVISIISYWIDKRAAQNGDRRTPESTLHFLSLACGWPGALIAQRILRHKSVKGAFRVVFWGTVLFNLVLLFVYLKKLV